MSKKYATVLLVMLSTIVWACDDEAATQDDDDIDDQHQESAEVDDGDGEVEKEQAEKQEETPVNETKTPADDEIGELPDGIGVAAGESAPDVATENEAGEQVDLLELVEDEAIVLFFYRGGWCPYCNFQVREMTENFDEFDDRGVKPVAISVDRSEKAAETTESYDIPYPVLSDPDLTVHEAFSVTYEADDEEVERLAEFGMDIEEASGRDHQSYAIPGVFIIDREGTVRWAHANPDYQIRPSPQQLLAVIDELE